MLAWGNDIYPCLQSNNNYLRLMTKVELFQKNIAERIEPLNYSNRKKYNNYMAIINGLNSDGTEDRTYLRELDDDLYFNAKDVKKGDIIVASCWNRYKNRQEKCYYIVLDITDSEMTIDDGHTTYRKAVKALSETEL